jgi:endonuclease I
MKNLAKLIIIISSTYSFAFGSTKAVYYSGLDTLSGYELKTRLNQILKKSHRDKGYSALISVYFSSDVDNTYDNDGSIMDIYSEDPSSYDPYNFRTRKNVCGQYRQESDCFNREHLFPQSAFGKANPMRSDFFHVFPTDGYVNGHRSNHPFGEVRNATWTSQNGSKLGSNTFGKYRGTVFEPIDEFKGDIARALLYFATRYEHRAKSMRHAMVNRTQHQFYADWFIALLLKWHKQDPVSQHEIQRNEVGFKYQGNRNPFIDHPEWVEKIWLQELKK